VIECGVGGPVIHRSPLGENAEIVIGDLTLALRQLKPASNDIVVLSLGDTYYSFITIFTPMAVRPFDEERGDESLVRM
jgi:hypothetical protein